MQPAPDPPSLGQLFSELARETSTLVKQEVALAKTEMKQKASEATKDASLIGVGGALAYAGLLSILAALVLLLAHVMPAWIAAFVVGLSATLGGYALLRHGVTTLRAIDPKPRETIQTLKEDKVWLEQQMR